MPGTSIPTTARSEVSSSDVDFQEWDERDEDNSVKCLFCPVILVSTKCAVEHCIVAHDFDLISIIKTRNFDFYQRIKLVNYVRTVANKSSVQDIKTYIQCDKEWLESETYLKPVIENDAFLFDLDELVEATAVETHNPVEDALATAIREKQELQVKFSELCSSFAQYKNFVQEKVLGERLNAIELRNEPAVEVKDDSWDMDGYFSGYSHFGIHETMLKDTVRTEAYRDFIYDNKDYFKGKIVLDVGCGTGILSMFAAKAGAAHVYAVDNSTIINFAQRNAKENGLDNVITFISGKIEEVTLPVQQVDIIISEWMGYFLLFEAMLDSVLRARDIYLKPNGILAPSQATMFLAPFEDEEYIYDKHHYWDQVYGFSMAPIKENVVKEGQIDTVCSFGVVSEPAVIKHIDIGKDTIESLDFVSEFKFLMKRDANLHGIVGWFDCSFDGSESDNLIKVTLPTGPMTKSTHWQQTLFLFHKTLSVKRDDIIAGTIDCRKKPDNDRGLLVTLKYSFKEQEYEQIYIIG